MRTVPSPYTHPTLQQCTTLTTHFATQVDRTGARAIDGTVYTNAGSTTMFVCVSMSGTNKSVSAYCDNNADPALLVGTALSTNSGAIEFGSVHFPVPAGYKYKVVTTAGTTLLSWVEYT